MKLSGSTDGKNISVVATSTPGTTIHTAHATYLDEIFIYAVNTSASSVLLTIEYGGTTTADKVTVTVPAQGSVGSDGPILVIPGFTLTNSLVVRAFAATTAVININGYVHRHS